jgi:hypothetical protein
LNHAGGPIQTHQACCSAAGRQGPRRHRDARTKKLLPRDAKVVARPLAKNDQSFFASFCSQKEVLSFFAF